jgi:cyclohexyl-isocyanide hydratase
MQVGFLVFPDVQQLDLTAPYELFASVPRARVHLLWKERLPVLSSTGLPLQPTATLRECPALDVLCVPGGTGVNDLMQDREVLDFLRLQETRARYVTSVCTGALVLGAAGLLRGRRATTHWASHHLLARFGAMPVDARVVRDGNVFTAGGVTAGIDFGLTLIAELLGQAQAEAIQLALEYAPEPPFRAGTPRDAPPAVVALERARLAGTLAKREAIIAGMVGNESAHPRSR